MNIVAPVAGIDVSKDELVISVDGGKPLRFANSQQGCSALIQVIGDKGTVHLESSGGYERLVRRRSQEAGLKVVVHNPLKPRRMAQAKGRKAKTDPVDARALSEWGPLLPEGSLRNLERQQLADYSRAIQTLKQMGADLKQQLDRPELDEDARRLYTEALLDLEKRIRLAEKGLHKRLCNSAFGDGYKLVQSVPAVGRITAAIVICELPEDYMDRTGAQIGSYAGMAPIDDSSGKRTGRSRIGHGNSRLKAAFYMPAICAVRSQPWARDLYARLRSEGRSHQSAIVAVMRRLLIRVHAVLKRGSAWEAEPPKA